MCCENDNKPLLPGYKKFIVIPRLAGLDFAQGTIPTPAKNIEIKYSKIDCCIEMNFPPVLQAVLDGTPVVPGTYRIPSASS
jgi:hypothetical protein